MSCPNGYMIDAGPDARRWVECTALTTGTFPTIVRCPDGYEGPQAIDPRDILPSNGGAETVIPAPTFTPGPDGIIHCEQYTGRLRLLCDEADEDLYDDQQAEADEPADQVESPGIPAPSESRGEESAPTPAASSALNTAPVEGPTG